MKFQDDISNMNTYIHTYIHTDKLKPICPPLFQSWGHKNSILTSIRGSNSVANLPKFELIQAFMHVLLTCKNEVDQIKNEGARVFTRFLPL